MPAILCAGGVQELMTWVVVLFIPKHYSCCSLVDQWFQNDTKIRLLAA